MTGMELKIKTIPFGKSVTELARMVGLSQQGMSQVLSSKDVKTGLVEKLASALNLPLSYFYGEEKRHQAVANDSHTPSSPQSQGNEIALATENKILREQNEFLQSQVKTLLSIISKDK